MLHQTATTVVHNISLRSPNCQRGFRPGGIFADRPVVRVSVSLSDSSGHMVVCLPYKPSTPETDAIVAAR